jgi:hypothetical protein
MASRRAFSKGERLVALSDRVSGKALDGSAALAVAGAWLEDLPPIEARSIGADRIEQRRADGAKGARIIEAFLTAVSPVRIGLRRAKRGRPPGRDPFSGAGFDLTVCMLLDSDRRWTERGLAEATERSPSLVHRNVQELARRGYVGRVRGATFVTDVDLLRQDLLSSWRANLGVARPARRFAVPRGKDPAAAVFAAARKQDIPLLLAGPSAATGAARLVGQTLTLYVGAEHQDTLVRGFEERPQLGDFALWVAPERGVFLKPRKVGTLPATNRVVTWLDLMLLGSDRARAAAEVFWARQKSSPA